jgi:hypothetical protein
MSSDFCATLCIFTENTILRYKSQCQKHQCAKMLFIITQQPLAQPGLVQSHFDYKVLKIIIIYEKGAES